MSQGFKLKFDEMRAGNPTHPTSPDESGAKAYEQHYPEESGVRSLCLVWRDGRRIFLNYSFLVSAEYIPDGNEIRLSFTSQLFVLKGVNLQSLFYDLMSQSIRQITCVDERYNLVGEDERFVVNEIIAVLQQR